MKAKKMFVMMAVVCGMAALLTANAHAGYQWYDQCQVLTAGPGGTNVYVVLTDVGGTGAFTDKTFRAYTLPKEILATCLTAMNMGCLIEAKVDVGAGLIKGARLTLNPAP